ncbi:hypothetical protein J3S85_37780 [Streptomyces lavenduligriseus]|nr:hypothetical protein J3S85_37780 [Streptomyces lavenduligriseus]
MVRGGTTIHTADGSTVTVRRRGIEYDLEVRNAKGDTIATVVMTQNDLDDLYEDLDAYTTVEWEAA